jgi:hypothetical protein
MSKKLRDCFILFHLSTGDCLTMYACICHYAEIYKNIYIFCFERNQKFIKQLYENKNVIVNVSPQIEHNNCPLHYAAPLSHISKYVPKLKDYDLIKSGNSFSYDGKIIDEWKQLDKYGEFWKKFYVQVHLPYKIRYEYTNINRNYKSENDFYNKIKKIYGEKFIFVQDHQSINYNHKGRRCILNENIINNEIPIFHPNINFYKNHKTHKFYNLWNKDLISDNLLDYCTILEKSEKIIMIDSSFSCLCVYLNLNNVKEKIIYSSLDLIDYHKSFNDWVIKRK